MPYPLLKRNFDYWQTLLARMQEAHANSGAALPEALKSALDAAAGEFDTLIRDYTSLRARDKQARANARQLTRDGVAALRKVKWALIYQAPAEKRDYILNRYNLQGELPGSRNKVVAALRTVQAIVAADGDDANILPAAAKTAAQQAFTALNQKVEELNALRADLENAKRQLQAAHLANAELRERIYAYLVTTLEGGSRDPKLIDYGLRSQFRPRRRVSIVEEQETPAPAPVPAPIAAGQ